MEEFDNKKNNENDDALVDENSLDQSDAQVEKSENEAPKSDEKQVENDSEVTPNEQVDYIESTDNYHENTQQNEEKYLEKNEQIEKEEESENKEKEQNTEANQEANLAEESTEIDNSKESETSEIDDSEKSEDVEKADHKEETEKNTDENTEVKEAEEKEVLSLEDVINPEAAIEKKSEWKIPKNELKKIIEGLIFVSGRVTTITTLAKAVPDATKKEINLVIKELIKEWDDPARGFHLIEINRSFQFRSDAELSSYVQEMFKARPMKLSRPALETLAIVAYRQPITRAEIEEIRGVDVGGVVRMMLDKKLLKILGKKEEPGRPLIYGTSKEFLEIFNMSTLKDLPTLQEFQELTEENRLKVESTYSREEQEEDEEDDEAIFKIPDVHADDSTAAKAMETAADKLSEAVVLADETINEIMDRKPYDEVEDEEEEGEAIADVEVLVAPENETPQEPQTQKKDDLVDLQDGPDVDKQVYEIVEKKEDEESDV